jgi:predicted nucleic acid-binding protein
MKPLKIYLDTSVISFLYAEDSPDFQNITNDFFNLYVRQNRYDCYVSEVVVLEIERTLDPDKQDLLMEIVRKYRLPLLPLTEEIGRLADIYLDRNVVPRKKIEDAQHLAIATCHQMDVLLSWNFKHLANIRTQSALRTINEIEGFFYPLRLANPMEVMYENEDENKNN